ncbi:MAG: phosphatidylserine decarboxylase [Opitutales bacterium]|jgi:phosphatidylserine decarboxylase
MAKAPEAARGAAIEYFNRHTGRVETEQVYGEAALRWAYENPLGRWTNWAVGRRAWLGRWYGWWMRQPITREKIAPFIERYGLEAGEFAEAPEAYKSFDAFFSRKLRPGARPLAGGEETVVFGADGRHLGFPDVTQAEGVFVKGQRWDLTGLLGDAALAEQYARGTLVLSRLCPVDYHRFHFPTAGTPGAARWLPGSLWSVNPIALRQTLARLWENKRMLTVLETPRLGRVLLLEIGATNVGSITQTFASGVPAERGAEKGYFSFGGSATVTLFEPGRVKLAEDLVGQTRAGRELYARMGSKLGVRAG